MKILVTGATGQLGSVVVETLLKKMPAKQIVVISRSAEKVLELQSKGLKAFQGDYDDLISLEKAMKGVDKVLLISSSDPVNRMQQHRNVVDAAKKIGVKHIAYTGRSLRNVHTLENKLMVDHFLTEDYIRESGIAYIIYRNALYMDVLVYYVGKNIFETGFFPLPAGDGKVAFALRKDIGEAIANSLVKIEIKNKIIKFTGNASYSFHDVAAALSELSGKEIKYMPLELDTYIEKMKETGLPERMIKLIADFNIDIKNGQEDEVTSEMEQALGRKPISLKEGLKILFGL